MGKIVVVDAVRSAVGRAKKGSLANRRPDASDRDEEAAECESDLRRLLAGADPDFPMLRQLDSLRQPPGVEAGSE